MELIQYIFLITLGICLIKSISCKKSCTKEVDYQFLEYVIYEHCEGKETGNYSLINQYTRNKICSRKSTIFTKKSVLVSSSHNSKQSKVNELRILASQVNPNGAMDNIDILYVVTSGPLEGKYVYERQTVQSPKLLKICSSILSYSYDSSKYNVLLIGDKLNLNVLVSPSGGFEMFKKGCTTNCKGQAIIVGPTEIREHK